MFCSDSNDGKCEWPAFNTLDLCLHTSDVSNHVEKSGDYVTLPELREFLPKDQDPPAFVSGARVYVAEARNATGMPTTSAGDGTNLPSLATIYFLYYDSCRGDKQGFDKKDPGRWTALKGDFQMCVQKYKLETQDRTAISPPIKPTTSTTSLWWNKTTKEDTPAYCTNVDEDEFCVGEPVMDKLASKMSRAFNATADFSVENRFDIVYSAQWVPKLTNTAFGGSDDIKPLECHAEQSGSGWQSGGQHADPFSGGGEFEFRVLLEGIADSLSLAYVHPLCPLVFCDSSQVLPRSRGTKSAKAQPKLSQCATRWQTPAMSYKRDALCTRESTYTLFHRSSHILTLPQQFPQPIQRHSHQPRQPRIRAPETQRNSQLGPRGHGRGLSLVHTSCGPLCHHSDILSGDNGDDEEGDADLEVESFAAAACDEGRWECREFARVQGGACEYSHAIGTDCIGLAIGSGGSGTEEGES
jgi:hypothetical protein